MIWKNTLNVVLKPFGKEARRQAGMTIIEILIVIALIGTIMTIIMTNVLQKSDEAKVDLARIAAAQLENALRLYKLNNNRYPTTEEGLQALLVAPPSAKNWRGPYTEADKLKDPWANDFTYESTSAKAFKITSPGQDGELGNADDVIYPADAAAPSTDAKK
ncbi:MAG: type II secretion system major pseudopilin GspG [Chitinophagaceae bacterium]|nr:type II secretion system major pseudopilin GspG [Oligoflexus sp.]